MARADRLPRLLHALRTLPAPVTAARLAEATEVSPRQVYRDIDALRAAGARIDGEAGWGYALAEDPALPPQSFTRLEIEALLLGLSEVRQSGDATLARAAEAVAAKVVATLPERQVREAAHAVLHLYRRRVREVPQRDLPTLREAAWEERAVDLFYRDEHGRATARRVWPLVIAYADTGMPGGPDNPLGARALYLYAPGRGDTLLRIHGTNAPETIGTAVSNGCARLLNDHITELYKAVPLNARVVLYAEGASLSG